MLYVILKQRSLYQDFLIEAGILYLHNGGFMHSTRYHNLIAIVLIAMLASCGGPSSPQQHISTPQSIPTQQGTTPTPQSTSVTQLTPPTQGVRLQHIFYIMMENHGTNQILGNTADAPYLNQLANTYGIATHYYAVTHPSLPNYLAAISGDFQGIWDDCPAGATITCAPQELTSSLTQAQVASAANRPHLFNGQTIVDQLEAHNLTWKAYMQSMPSTGFTGASDGLYAQKHNPFMYFARIRNNASRMQQIVPLTQLDRDIQSRNVPDFVWITPDVCADMHGDPSCASYDSLIMQGDNFVHTMVQKITASSTWKEGSAIVIVWDENNMGLSGCCRSPIGVQGITLGGADVPIIVITSHGAHHLVLANTAYNHYSLLATIEHLWNLGCLANTCAFNDNMLMTTLFN
ncbi:MAG: hypothetical protein NVS4B7_05740 [Ktedonobacteraceae bacterium]